MATHLGRMRLVQVIGQALGGLPHGIEIHAVGARAQLAAQPAGAERPDPGKSCPALAHRPWHWSFGRESRRPPLSDLKASAPIPAWRASMSSRIVAILLRTPALFMYFQRQTRPGPGKKVIRSPVTSSIAERPRTGTAPRLRRASHGRRCASATRKAKCRKSAVPRDTDGRVGASGLTNNFQLHVRQIAQDPACSRPGRGPVRLPQHREAQRVHVERPGPLPGSEDI